MNRRVSNPDLEVRVNSPPRAFTLLEILLVATLAAMLAVGLGAALRDKTGPALQIAQLLVAGLIQQARTAATANQTETRLVVCATRSPAGEPATFLRLLQVFRADPQGSQFWVPVGLPVFLPPAVCVVPPSTDGLLASGVVWPAGSGSVSHLVSESGTPFRTALANAATVLSLRFGSDGLPASDTALDFKIIVASFTGPPARPQFNNPTAVRAVLLRSNGAITLPFDPGDF